MRFLVLIAAAAAAFGQTKPLVTLVTSDIDNFWKAYDASKPGDREEAFHKMYLAPASLGLRDFFELRISSARQLAYAVDKQYPKFYASVRKNTMQVEKQQAAILKYAARFAELYPEAKFPTVYFVVGRLTSGGTTSDRGLLIGVEVQSLGPEVDASEVSPSLRRAMGTPDHLPLIVIHELTHTQVKRTEGEKIPKMLGQCVEEGAADFMTELVANSSINAYAKEWTGARRDELFQRFARDMREKPDDASKWLYNYRRVTEGEPADLGYWIGAEICRSYYAKAQDKAAAVRNAVRLSNIEEIVRNSDYAWLLK